MQSFSKEKDDETSQIIHDDNAKLSIFVETLAKPKKNHKKKSSSSLPSAAISKKLSNLFRDDEELMKYFNMNCDKCLTETGQPLTFSSTDENRLHFKQVHKLMFRCNGICRQCNVKKTSASKMREHIRFHLKPHEFQCKICLKYSSNHYNLRQHELCHAAADDYISSTTTQLIVRRFQCDICEDHKSFATKAAIYGHMQLKHTDRKRVVAKGVSAACDICNKK